ncbi:hypothetical protein NDU88_012254 [Pleurodeles waltl]|uniref:Uncharacterized protein n=1 Tax=Pleurodeles waltl TaxID=8319 RepID=A0AAV7QZL4_PLEWA|nr:hypothetical protein NDU88_012254 [Pleurodeles waltl]
MVRAQGHSHPGAGKISGEMGAFEHVPIIKQFATLLLSLQTLRAYKLEIPTSMNRASDKRHLRTQLRGASLSSPKAPGDVARDSDFSDKSRVLRPLTTPRTPSQGSLDRAVFPCWQPSCRKLLSDRASCGICFVPVFEHIRLVLHHLVYLPLLGVAEDIAEKLNGCLEEPVFLFVKG